MSPATALAVAAAFALGALSAWLVAAWLRRQALEQQRVALADRLATAEARAEGAAERRDELEDALERWRRSAADADRRAAVAEERLARTRERLEERESFVERSRRELESAFKALAAAALEGSSEQFLRLAEQRLAEARSRAAGDLDQRRAAVAALVEPLRETVERLERRTGEIERARGEAYSRIDQQVRLLAEATAALDERAGSLTAALEGSRVKGRWGELSLRNAVELAGMAAHCDFVEQSTVAGGGRPDMVVRLPGGRTIAVDAKVPLKAYLEANRAASEAVRRDALGRHARALKGHVRNLAARDYAAALDGGVDLVVLYLPGDPFLAAALASDPDLQTDALAQHVLLATPTNLVGLLRTVALAWQQQSVADNAAAIAATARELHQRAVRFGGEMAAVGRGLGKAVAAYNRAVGSWERRLRPMARRLEELDVIEEGDGPAAPEAVDEEPRRPDGG